MHHQPFVVDKKKSRLFTTRLRIEPRDVDAAAPFPRLRLPVAISAKMFAPEPVVCLKKTDVAEFQPTPLHSQADRIS